MAQRKILLSACLAGVKCAYDATDKAHPYFVSLFKKRCAEIFCPEKLGGLKIPHPSSEIQGGDGFDVWQGRAKVFSRAGKDVTSSFKTGALKTLKLAQKTGLKTAVMKARSPSCGCGEIYDGTFCGAIVSGYGVTAALLKANGLTVISDEDYLEKEKLKVKSEKLGQKKRSREPEAGV